LATGCGSELESSQASGDEAEVLGSTSAALVNPCANNPGNEYVISAESAADHADDDTPGSIAWHFKTYGACNTYSLGPGIFGISAGVKMPVGATLRAQNRSATRILPHTSGLPTDKWTMIQMTDFSSLSAIQADGNSNPSTIVNADLTTAVSIDHCILRESVGHVITADLSAELSVTNSTISLAGINVSKALPSTPGGGHGINCFHCFDLEVKDTTINFTRAAGIFMTGTLGAVIARNTIFETTWNMRVAEKAVPQPTGYGGGDAITAYHNNSNPYPVDYHIYENDIWLFHNNGIHVSGDGIDIHDNYVDGHADRDRNGNGVLDGDATPGDGIIDPNDERYGHSALWIGDHRPFPGGDCSKNLAIENNELYVGVSDYAHPGAILFTHDLGIENFQTGTVFEAGNVGTAPGGGVDRSTMNETTCQNVVRAENFQEPYVASPKLYYEFRHGVGVANIGVDTMLNQAAAKVGDAGPVMDEQLGRVLGLDGNGDYLNVPHHAELNANQFTIFAIVKPTYQTSAMQIFSKDCSSCNQRSWQFRLTNNAHLELIVFKTVSQSTTVSSASQGVTIPAGVWSYVVGTYDGSSIKLYSAPVGSDLVLVGQGALTGTVADSTVDARIGSAQLANQGFFKGRIDDVAFWSRALTPEHLKETTQWGHMIMPDHESLH
jgi:hypothetical protein